MKSSWHLPKFWNYVQVYPLINVVQNEALLELEPFSLCLAVQDVKHKSSNKEN